MADGLQFSLLQGVVDTPERTGRVEKALDAISECSDCEASQHGIRLLAEVKHVGVEDCPGHDSEIVMSACSGHVAKLADALGGEEGQRKAEQIERIIKRLKE